MEHYLSAAPSASNLRNILSRFREEFNQLLGTQIPMPASESEAVKFSPQVLRFAGQEALQRGKTLCILLGGLERVTYNSGQKLLAWLPAKVPPGVVIVVSCNYGPVLKHLLNTHARPGQAVAYEMATVSGGSGSGGGGGGGGDCGDGDGGGGGGSGGGGGRLHRRGSSASAEHQPGLPPPNGNAATRAPDDEEGEWVVLKVDEFTDSEKAEAAVKHLAMYGKKLSQPQLARIQAAPSTANPLFLSTFLGQIRLCVVEDKQRWS